MKVRTLILSMLVSQAIVGCITVPLVSEKAAKVQVHRQVSNLLDNCKKLGPVSGTLPASNYNDVDLESRIREATVDLDGDTVVLLNQDAVADRVTIQGIAFKCY